MEQVPTWVSLTQIGASISLGLAALTVAIVSLFVAYRNNFGWPPIALVSGFGLRLTTVPGKTDSERVEEHSAIVHLEIWNRRKYPINIRHVSLTFSDLTHPGSVAPAPTNSDWLVGDKEAFNPTTHTLAATAQESHTIYIPYRSAPLDPKAHIKISVDYFDPRSNKSRKLKFEYQYRISPDNHALYA